MSDPSGAELEPSEGGFRSLFQVEERGIEPVPRAEQTSEPKELFWIWFAGNISILGLPLGIWVVAGVLNIWQALVATVIGAVGSFAIVGVVSIAGQRGGAPSLTLSRATFGVVGNFAPTVVAIVSRWGWETVNAVTAAFAVISIGSVITGRSLLPSDAPWVAITAVVIFLLLTLAVSGMGHNTLALVQRWATYVFGALTLVIVAALAFRVDWSLVFSAEAGPGSAVIIAIGTVAAGTGIAWANSGADLGRYQSPSVKPWRLVTASAFGAGIPLVIMIGTGSLIAITEPQFDPDNPLSSIPALLPPWMSIPFLLAAFFGLLMSNNISVYSSGLTLLTLGIKTRRVYAVMIELVASLVGSMLFLFVLANFYDGFIGFITLLAVPLVAWLAVFLLDMIKRTRYNSAALLDMKPGGAYWYRGGVEWRALGAWLLGIIAGYSMRFDALSETWVALNGLDWALTMVVSSVAYLALGGLTSKGIARDVPSSVGGHSA